MSAKGSRIAFPIQVNTFAKCFDLFFFTQHCLFRVVLSSFAHALVVHVEVTPGVPLGSSAGEGWLPGGGVGKLKEAPACLPLHGPAALCQDEEDRCGVSPLLLSIQRTIAVCKHRAI